MRRGHELLSAYAPRAGIPLERVGALLVAWSEEEHDALPGDRRARTRQRLRGDRRDRGARSSTGACRHLGPGARAALEVPDEGILCTFTTPLAFATEAVLAGCELRLGCEVRAVRRTPPTAASSWPPRAALLRARFLVNAAGLFSDELDRLLGHDAFTVTPRRGQLIVFDKLAGPLLGHILLAVPSETTKGVLLAPTVYGNVLLGPDRRGGRRPPRHLNDRRRARPSARRGPAADARTRAPRGDGRLRRPEGRDRARRLPARDPCPRGVRVRRRDPLDRPVRVDGDRRARPRAARGGGARPRARRRRRPRYACRTSASTSPAPTNNRT